ncbi:MAG: Ig-like domain-containing protein [Geminicoccaceae bacterium]|uniref:Ig-like domain-containing protein n=1 Tax=Reyranella sp. TaxID=1929291 RepID=UPI003D120991
MRTTSIESIEIADVSRTLLFDDDPMAACTTTTTATDLASILSTAIAGGYVAHGGAATYTVSSPIVIHVNSTIQGPLGIDLGGATIVSQITNGAPVIEIDVGAGVDLRYLTLSNFTILGNGAEGDGIKIVAAGNDRWAYNWSIDNVTVNHVGGYGLDMQGSVFEGLISNSWMTNNAKGGAYFTHLDGGIVSAVHWFGGGLHNNGGAGLALDNGARDMNVDGATITNNNGAGISASQGITSVTASTIADNYGPGVWFQNYGNFNENTFSNSTGTQSVGITGYLAGNVTLVGNTSTDLTTLASLDGYGGAFEASNTGTIVNGPGVSASGLGGGNLAQISQGAEGVALPTLAPITAATTAPLPTSNGTSSLEQALKAAMEGSYVAHLTDSSYTVTAPIVINVTSANQGAFGIDLGGAKILSQISDGGPVIEIFVGPGVNLSKLTLANFGIQGNGLEGDGIKIVVDGPDRAITDLSLKNVSVEHVGGIGLDVLGHVSHGLVFNSWMNGNAQGGARFANSPAGGVASGLEWYGGGFRHNGVAGMILDNGTHDMVVEDVYFVQNNGPGIAATSGISLVQGSGFENNAGTGAIVQGAGNFTDNTFSTYGPQTAGVGGYLTGDKVTLTANSNEYYGPGSDPTMLANVQGSGTLAIAGGGNVIVSPRISVMGGDPVVDVTRPPVVTGRLENDTGISPTDAITSEAALAGTADANATVHFTVDGSATSASATADGDGIWAFTPIGLADGVHTIAVSETNAAGLTGSASLTFTLDTTAPAVTESLVSGTTSFTTSPAVTGSGDPNAVVHFTIDGSATASTATADWSGLWSFTPIGLGNGTHTIVASETDAAGNIGSASLTFNLQAVSGLPAFTSMIDGNGSVTLTGATGEAGDTIWIYDGNSWIGGTTTDNSGNWSFTATASRNSVHAYGFNGIDLAGGIIQGTNKAILGSSRANTLVGGQGNDIIDGNGGNDTIVGGAGADQLTGGSGRDTFAYNAASHSTPAVADTITDFRHGDDKIDFTTIAGIAAGAHGVPSFQGNITGSGNLILNPHSVAYLEVGGNTEVLVNTTNVAETVTTSDVSAADMKVVLLGVNLGLASTDFHHA